MPQYQQRISALFSCPVLLLSSFLCVRVIPNPLYASAVPVDAWDSFPCGPKFGESHQNRQRELCVHVPGPLHRLSPYVPFFTLDEVTWMGSPRRCRSVQPVPCDERHANRWGRVLLSGTPHANDCTCGTTVLGSPSCLQAFLSRAVLVCAVRGGAHGLMPSG